MCQLLSYIQLCDAMECSLPGQARVLQWVAISFSMGSSQPGHRTRLLHCRRMLYLNDQMKMFLPSLKLLLKTTFFTFPGALYAAAAAKQLQSCPTLCDPIDGSPPGSSVPGILQARILEWVAISFSKGALYTCSKSKVFL